MSVVILAEKRDQAEKIAKALHFTQGRGCFQGDFQGKKAVLLWARGHLVTIQNPDEVIPGLSWSNPEELVPIPTSFPLKITDDIPGAPPAAQPKNYVSNIKQHMSSCSLFIISTDSDREGEAIGWNLLDYFGYKGPVQRAWLSKGLDEKSLKEAFGSLRPAQTTKSWYRASESRARSDWSFMFLVRAYTHYARFGAFGGELGTGQGREGVMSVGRVQTPALAMIVRREREIRNFVPVDHFKLSGNFSLAAGNLDAAYRPVVTAEVIERYQDGIVWDQQSPKKDGTPVLDRPLFTDRAALEAFKARLMAVNDQARVASYRSKMRSEQPPKTFSLTDAQQAIGKSLKLPAALVQTILEDLYEQGWTSYARTSKANLPENLYEASERNGMLNAISKLRGISEQALIAQSIHNNTHPSVRAFMPKVYVSKAMEHYGIVPTSQVMTPEAFAGLTPKKAERGSPKHTQSQMQQAYLMVAKQFIQALYPAAEWAVQEIELTLPTEDLLGAKVSHFSTKGERLVEPGWRAAFGAGVDKDTSLPLGKDNDSAKLVRVDLATAKTTAPKRYTDITFPKAMENVGREVRDPELRKRLKDSEGLGTPATRKTIIETLAIRNYVTVQKGAFYATSKGEQLVDTVPDWLASPETTALWEDSLVDLCAEQDDGKAIAFRDNFVTGQIDRIESIINGLAVSTKGKLLDKPISQPGRITPRMKKAIQQIAKNKGISIPRGTLSNPAEAKSFLDTHIVQREAGDNSPSPAALAYAKNLIKTLPQGVEAPEDLETSSAACSKFIDMAKQYQAPPPGQLALAKKLVEEMPEAERPDPKFLSSGQAVSDFIDQRIGKKKTGKRESKPASGRTSRPPARKPSGGQKSASRPPATR